MINANEADAQSMEEKALRLSGCWCKAPFGAEEENVGEHMLDPPMAM